MVCQIVYVFYQMIFHESTREVIIKETRILCIILGFRISKKLYIHHREDKKCRICQRDNNPTKK